MTDDKKDINKRTEDSIQSVNTALSPDGNYLFFISNKAQKIVTALYLVTGNLPDNEPLKQNIRQKSLELIELSHKLNVDAVFSKKDKISSELRHIDSLISVGEGTGYISAMNGTILRREIGKLYTFLEDSPSLTAKKENILPEDFFNVPTSGNVPRSSEDPVHGATPFSSHSVKDNHAETFNRKETISPQSIALKPRKKSRRDFILNIIAKKKEVNIKDISLVFHGCSEKTIQRELTSLVNEGVVLKEGERRWSTYRLS